MNTLVISWHKYQPHVEHYSGHRVHWEYWLKMFAIWASEVDSFYLIDQEMEFTEEDEKRLKELCPDTHILKSEVHGHHWEQFKWALPQIEGKRLLFLDNDVVIKEKGLVGSWFAALSDHDFIGSFDGSGGLQEQMQNKFPLLKQLNATRMGTYYFGMTRKFLDKVNFFEFQPWNYYEGEYIPELDYKCVKGDWSDSFGLFTIKMLALNPKIEIIKDLRDTIYLEDSGAITRFPDYPTRAKYYHIRNVNLANYVMTSWADGRRQDYLREIGGNRRELRRLLAWFDIMDRETGNHFRKDINHLLKDLGNLQSDWEFYIKEFRNYHNV